LRRDCTAGTSCSEFYRDARLPASRVYDLLHPLDIEQVLVMMAKARKEPAKRYISLYLTGYGT